MDMDFHGEIWERLKQSIWPTTLEILIDIQPLSASFLGHFNFWSFIKLKIINYKNSV